MEFPLLVDGGFALAVMVAYVAAKKNGGQSGFIIWYD
jgi:hypothetical protein